MAGPVADVELVRHASRRLLRTAEELTDDEVGEPCLLPGWSRAELLTHLARNADGTRGMVEEPTNMSPSCPAPTHCSCSRSCTCCSPTV